MNSLKNCPTLRWKHRINIFIYNAYKKKEIYFLRLEINYLEVNIFFHSFLFEYNKFIK
jgi:hypothetical protein